MILCDVNVFVYAHKEGTPHHRPIRAWLQDAREAEEPFGFSDEVLASFVRLVTNKRVFDRPSSIDEALRFTAVVRDHPNSLRVGSGPRRWAIFERLCRDSRASGNLVPDAWLAALAIESGCEWVSTDGDYARFPGLRWRHPLGD